MTTQAYKGIKDKFGFIVESVPSGIVMIDGAGKIIFVNTVVNRMFGYSGRELVGKSIEVLVPERFRESHVSFRGTFMDTPSAWPMGKGRDLFALRKDGSEFPVEIGLNPVKTKDGVIVLSTVVDITERKGLEDRQRELLESLEKVNSELSDFAHRVSHDLKAPLRAISALADWLSEDYADKLDESGVETLGLLKARVVRMSNLIDGILSYSRAVREEEIAVAIDLRELVDDIVGALSPPPGIKVTFESGNGTGTVYCDRTRLEQVFQNLLTNAIKYNDKPEGTIDIRCARRDGMYLFSVADNGIGIEEKYFEKIFQMFQTLSPREKSETAGIGLAIVKKIIENYGGRIWLESEPGKGTTFYFTLPDRAPARKEAGRRP